MSQRVVLNMNNSSALVTVAMLSTMLSEKNSDYLDIISPFVLTLLPTKIGSKVDCEETLSALKKNYGFEEFPHHVLTKLLSRFCKQKYGYLERNHGDFYVKKTYADSTKFFDNQQKIRDAHSAVMEQLQSYLQSNTKYATISIEKTREIFLRFLEKKGLSFIHGITDLKTVTSNDYDLYHVARFVIAEHDKKSATYMRIEEVVRGFFVYKAIYMFSKEDNVTIPSKPKETVVFFDTRLLIEALGYNTAEGKLSARELISLVTACGGKVMTFSHLVDEVRGILTAFGNDPHNGVSFSLQYLSDQGYDAVQVERLKTSLKTNLEKIGITSIDAVDPKRLSDDEFAPLWLNDLAFSIQETYGEYFPTSRSRNDVRSVASIYDLRGNAKCTSLEDCYAIMATPNLGFVNTVHDFYKDSYIRDVGFLISDIDITSLLWLQTWDKKSKLPSIILLENAYAACRLTPETYNAFCETVEMLKNEGELTEEGALMLRTQKAPREDLLVSSQNNAGYVSVKTVREIKDRYIDSLTVQKNERISTLEHQLSEERSKNQERKNKAIDNAEQKANDAANFTKKFLRRAFSILFAGLFVAGTIALIVGQFSGEAPVILSVILILIGVIGLFDSIKSRIGFVYRLITRASSWVFAKVHDKELSTVYEHFYDI